MMRRLRLCAGVLGVGGLIAACSEPAAGPQNEPDLLSVPVKSAKAKPVETFNATVAKAVAAGQTWPQDHRSLAREFADGWGPREVWRFEGKGDNPSRYAVTVVFDGFSGDSVRGERQDFVIALEADETWRVAEGRIGWRCWRGRRQQEYSADPCS